MGTGCLFQFTYCDFATLHVTALNEKRTFLADFFYLHIQNGKVHIMSTLQCRV